MWTVENEKLKAVVIGRSEIRVRERKKLGFVEERNLGARKKLGITIEQIRVRGRSENQSIYNDSRRKDLRSPSVRQRFVVVFIVGRNRR